MKKSIKLLSILLFFVVYSFSAFALEGKVISTSGKVELLDGGTWISLQEGDIIEKGAVISTGFRSSAIISIKKSEFKLGPLTRITIEDLVSSQEDDTTQLFIDSGSIDANVNPDSGKRVGFKVRSPVATASVRGTIFNLNCAGDLRVERGAIAFGRAESKSAKVTNTEEKTPQKKESKTTLVKAKQKSSTNIHTGKQSNPMEEKILNTTGVSGNTNSASNQESKNTAHNLKPKKPTSHSSKNSSTGSIFVTVTFN